MKIPLMICMLMLSLAYTQELDQKNSNKAVKNQLQYFEYYCSIAERVLKGYSQRIETSQNPEEAARNIKNELTFHIAKAKEALQETQQHFAGHPYTIQAAQKFKTIQQKAAKAIPAIIELGTIQHAKLIWVKIHAILKQNPTSLASLQQAGHLYVALIEYMKKYPKIAKFKGVLPRATLQLRQCQKKQIQWIYDVIFADMEKKNFDWIATNLQTAQEVAGNDPEFVAMILEQEPKVIHAACQKAMQLQASKPAQSLEDWHSHYWKKIIAIATQPEMAAIVLDYTKQMLTQQLDAALQIISKVDDDPILQLQEFRQCTRNAKLLAGKDETLLKLIAAYQAQFVEPEQKATVRYEQKLAEIARERQARFERSLSPDQLAVYNEWRKQNPDQNEEDHGQVKWVYMEENTSSEVDTYYTYWFDSKGVIIEKEIKHVGGGEVHGYRGSSWTQIAEVKKDGRIYGYRGSSWTQLAEVKEDGEIRGYPKGSSSWTQLGEIRESGSIYGYRGSSWTQLAEVRSNGDVYGYKGSSWTQLAEIRDNGDVYGYKGSSWTQLASAKVATRNYQVAVLLLMILDEVNLD